LLAVRSAAARAQRQLVGVGRAYDASYLRLSRNLRAELVMLDAKLARASAEA